MAKENKKEALIAFERLLHIMDELREGCPWDRKQTWESLRILTIEEVYELSEAILAKDAQELAGELGDIFLHLVFYARIAKEKSLFTLDEVLNKICDKLIERHPHIYGDVEAEDEATVKQNWEKIKLAKGAKGVLAGVPNGLPPITKAFRMQEKAAGVGFDWDEEKDVWAKVEEELEEFKVEVKAEDQALMEDEFGDLLFALINYARFKNINPETALQKANHKFKTRFDLMEQKMKAAQKEWDQMNLEEMDIYWEEAKIELRTQG